MVGVVGGVECSDGERQCMNNAAVWLYVTLMQTCVRCFVQLGYTALCYASQGGHLEVAQWLVSSVGSNAATDRNEVCSAAVTAVCDAGADACVVFVCSGATLHFCMRVREDTWRSHSGWCHRRGRMR